MSWKTVLLIYLLDLALASKQALKRLDALFAASDLFFADSVQVDVTFELPFEVAFA